MPSRSESELTALAQRVKDGQPRAVARAITMAEAGGRAGEDLVDLLHGASGTARIIGVTGPPGAGKSTLVDGLITELRRQERRVGVLAVDPSSPFSGGALLGDRLRMGRHAADRAVFIRSMATRGHRGGLTLATTEAAGILDAAGFDTIIIETVGVGQSEVEIMSTADAVMVVLVPGAGDDIQALKAGIMEIGDIYVVNKADLAGAAELAAVLRFALRGEVDPDIANSEHLGAEHAAGYDPRDYPAPRNAPQILLASALDGSGLPQLIEALDQRLAQLDRSGELVLRRRQRGSAALERIAQSALRDWLAERGIVAGDPGQLLREFDSDSRGPHRFIRDKLQQLTRSRAGGEL